MGTRVTPSYPHFALKNGLLYQVVRNKDQAIEQLLVPQLHGSTVSPHLLEAHLWVEKTKESVFQEVLLARSPIGDRELLPQLPRVPDH